MGETNRESFNLYKKMSYKFMPSMFNQMINLLQQRIDKIFLGIYISTTSVAIYNISISIANMSLFLLNIVNTVVTPMISKLFYENKHKELEELYKMSTLLSAMFNLLFCAFVIISGRVILDFFGEEFAIGYSALIIVTIGQIINAGVGPVASIINMIGKPKVLLGTNLIAITINITLNSLLIPRYDLNGAAFTTMISLIVLCTINTIYVYKKLKIHPFSRDMIMEVIIIILGVAVGMLPELFLNCNIYLLKIIELGIFGMVFVLLNVLFGIHTKIINTIKEIIAQRRKMKTTNK